MTHLSRSDSDKMLSDMAEGSADYGDHESPYEEYDDEDDMSGSGDNMNCKLFLKKLIFMTKIDFLHSSRWP